MNLEVVLLEACLPLEQSLRQIGLPFRTFGLDAAIPEDSAAYFTAADTALSRHRVEKLLAKKRHVVMPENSRHHFSPSLFLPG